LWKTIFLQTPCPELQLGIHKTSRYHLMKRPLDSQIPVDIKFQKEMYVIQYQVLIKLTTAPFQ
jgi:hypothetical protein